MIARPVRIHAHRHIAEKHGDLRLEIDAPVFARRLDRVAGPDEIIRVALVHERVLLELRGHRRPARLAHQLDVGEIGARVQPLVGARQRCTELPRVELEGAGPRRAVQIVVELLELRSDVAPVVERRLERWRRFIGDDGVLEVLRHDDERAVARVVLERAELHFFFSRLQAAIPRERYRAWVGASSGCMASTRLRSSSRYGSRTPCSMRPRTVSIRYSAGVPSWPRVLTRVLMTVSSGSFPA